MCPAPVARISGHVDCGDLRLNVTAYLPFVFVLFRLPRSDEIPEGSLILMTRSKVCFTSAESKADPSWNVTPLLRLHLHVLLLPSAKHLVASTGWSFAPFGKPISCW